MSQGKGSLSEQGADPNPTQLAECPKEFEISLLNTFSSLVGGNYFI